MRSKKSRGSSWDKQEIWARHGAQDPDREAHLLRVSGGTLGISQELQWGCLSHLDLPQIRDGEGSGAGQDHITRTQT